MLHYIDIAIVICLLVGLLASPIIAWKMNLPMSYSPKMLALQFQMMIKTPILLVFAVLMAAISIYAAKWIGLEYTYTASLYSTIAYYVIGFIFAVTYKEVSFEDLVK